jgi:hypothetical protein
MENLRSNANGERRGALRLVRLHRNVIHCTNNRCFPPQRRSHQSSSSMIGFFSRALGTGLGWLMLFDAPFVLIGLFAAGFPPKSS